MKTYQIELKRTSYVNLTIEAANEEDAEAQAWKQVEADYYRDDGAWEIESIELETETGEDLAQFYGPSAR